MVNFFCFDSTRSVHVHTLRLSFLLVGCIPRTFHLLDSFHHSYLMLCHLNLVHVHSLSRIRCTIPYVTPLMSSHTYTVVIRTIISLFWASKSSLSCASDSRSHGPGRRHRTLKWVWWSRDMSTPSHVSSTQWLSLKARLI